jgi:hypothetical protein
MRTSSSPLHRIFLRHPESVNEGYFAHMRFALSFAGLLFTAAGAALVHAVVPCLCEKTASTIIKRLHHRMTYRTHHDPVEMEMGTLTKG